MRLRFGSHELFAKVLQLAQSPSSEKKRAVSTTEMQQALESFVWTDSEVSRGEVRSARAAVDGWADAAPVTLEPGARAAFDAWKKANGQATGGVQYLRRAEAFRALEPYVRWMRNATPTQRITKEEMDVLLGVMSERAAPARIAELRRSREWYAKQGEATPAALRSLDAWLASHPLPRPAAALDAVLTQKTQGLIWPSETDREVEPVSMGARKHRRMPDEAAFRRLVAEPSLTPVEVRDFAEVFDRLETSGDPEDTASLERAAKFGELRKALEQNLSDLRVYRVGSIDIDVYVLGRTPEGRLAGVMSSVVET